MEKHPLGRILLLLIIAFAIYLLFRGFFRAQTKQKPPEQITSEDMVACARCGVNLPRSEARDEGGQLVCRDNPQCH